MVLKMKQILHISDRAQIDGGRGEGLPYKLLHTPLMTTENRNILEGTPDRLFEIYASHKYHIRHKS